MQSTLLYQADGIAIHALVLDKGDEALDSLMTFCEQKNILAGSVTGLGAFSNSRLAFFNRKTKHYDPIPVAFQVEVLNLTGNIAEFEGRPKLHVHATVSRPDGTTIGGHLLEGIVWPTLEIMLTSYSPGLSRSIDDESGLPLLSM